VGDYRNVKLLVYENDPVPDLVARFIVYLINGQCLLLHKDYNELFSQSLIYFIETKLEEIGFSKRRSTLLTTGFYSTTQG
jgi:hypothetical protein